MFRVSLVSFLSSSSAPAAAAGSAALVLRNIPVTWMRREDDVVDFVRRVVAAAPLIPRSLRADNNGADRDGTGSAPAARNDSEEFSSMRSGQEETVELEAMRLRSATVPAGMVPEHVRQRWGLSPPPAEEAVGEDPPQQQRPLSSKSTAPSVEEFPELAKYFGNGKKSKAAKKPAAAPAPVAATQQPAAAAVTPQKQQEEPSLPRVFVHKVRFIGETARTTRVVVWFSSASAARRFSDALPSYLRFVARTRGRGLPAEVVGEVPDSDPRLVHGAGSRSTALLRKKRRFYEAETLPASALDVAVADSGLRVTPYDDPHSTLPAHPTEQQEREWRREVALALFRQVGERSAAAAAQRQQQQKQQQQQPGSSGSDSGDDAVRLRWTDMLRHKHLGNVGSARAEELAALQHGNPLLAAANDVAAAAAQKRQEQEQQQQQSLAEAASPAGDAQGASASRRRLGGIQPQVSALMFRRRESLFDRFVDPVSGRTSAASSARSMQGVEGDESAAADDEAKQDALRDYHEKQQRSELSEESAYDAAVQDELAAAAEMELDRYLMCPDVLWDTRRKYMRRRKLQWVKDGDGGGGDDDGNADGNISDDEAVGAEDDLLSDHGRQQARRGASDKRNERRFWSNIYA